jgi:phospholipid/cholesterol/gamma-HCH transport system substrate-binding protein
MKDAMRNFVVGITSIVALLGLAGLLFNFGELDRFFHPRYRITVRTDHAAGLRPGSGVDFNGVPVGTITEVTVEPDIDPSHPVRIVLMIDEQTRLPEAATLSASQPLIGGGARLQFTAPTGDEGATIGLLIPDDGKAEITRHIRGGMLEEMTAALDTRMGPLIRAMESFNKLSETYVSLGQNINEMLQTQPPEALEAGREPNVRTAVGKLNNALDDLRESLKLVQTWLGDEQMRADAKTAVAKATDVMDRISGAIDQFTTTAKSIQSDTNDVARRLMPVADSLATTLEDVRRLTQLATAGQGTVAQLLNNPDLYNSMTDAALRLERALTEAQLLIEKYKAEGVPVQF